MTQREKQAAIPGALPVRHQFAHDIVDGGDVVGVHRVAQSEHPCEQRRAEQRGTVVKDTPGPDPDAGVHGDQTAHGGDGWPMGWAPMGWQMG